jgi:hypothetical protein
MPTVHHTVAAALLTIGVAVLPPALAPAQPAVPPGALANNVRAVAYSEVDGRPPFKLSVQERDGRWYLYMGHLWHRGWTILDVTDPAKPTVANFISGPANTWTRWRSPMGK